MICIANMNDGFKIAAMLYMMLASTISLSGSEVSVTLPGIFSETFCRDDERILQNFQGFCKCRDQIKIDTVISLCSSYTNLATCIEKEIDDGSDVNNYLKLVFDKEQMLKNIQYICSIPNVEQVTTGDICDDYINKETLYRRDLQNTALDEEIACMITHTLSDGYMSVKNLKQGCKPPIIPTHRLFLSRLTESFLSNNCTKYSVKSRTDKCKELVNAVSPIPRGRVRSTKDETSWDEQCVRYVNTTISCLQRERADSKHPYDKWATIDLNLDNFVTYETRRCQLNKAKPNEDCLKKYFPAVKACMKIYQEGYERQTYLIRQHINVSVTDVCRMYSNVTECLDPLLVECTDEKLKITALFCRPMPASCSCPIEDTRMRKQNFSTEEVKVAGHETPANYASSSTSAGSTITFSIVLKSICVYHFIFILIFKHFMLLQLNL